MIIGRKKERAILDRLLHSGRPEFVAVYGRRRVGKTHLVREYFKDGFAFYATGVANEKTRVQLKAFGEALQEYGSQERTIPKDWFEAFSRLKSVLSAEDAVRDRASGRLVIFLDELPWFDTARSDFKTAFEYFWNGWASARDDIMLVVCGSATSWIITNLIDDYGGFHNRITRRIRLDPFTLGECEEYYRTAGFGFTRQQIVESYMVFGGIPYYLNLVDQRMSLAQNIDQLCFDGSAPLRNELGRLFRSLFKHSEKHLLIIEKLVTRRSGLTRAELERIEGIGGGGPLTKALSELEQCGFIRRYRDYAKRQEGHHYQVIDPFTLFSLRFLENGRGDLGEVGSWMSYLGSAGFNAWSGLAFEMVCLNHVRQIKQALGIPAVETHESAWKSSASDPGAQIDLLIDRKDGVVNICEMKFSGAEFVIDAAYEKVLRNKVDAFVREAAPNKALHLTMVTMHGVARNKHSDIVLNEVVADDLFA